MSDTINTITSGEAQGAAGAAQTNRCSKEFSKKVAPCLYDAIYAFCHDINRIYESQYNEKVKTHTDALWNRGARGREFYRKKVDLQRNLLYEIIEAKSGENTPISSFFVDVFLNIKDSKGFFVKAVHVNKPGRGIIDVRAITNSMVTFIYNRNKALLEKHAQIMGFEPPAAPKPKEKKPAAAPPMQLPQRYEKFCGQVKGADEVFSFGLYDEVTRFIKGVLEGTHPDAQGKFAININEGYKSVNSNKARVFMHRILKINVKENITLKEVFSGLIVSYYNGKIKKERIIDAFLEGIFRNKEVLAQIKPWTQKFDSKLPWHSHPLNNPELTAEVPTGRDRIGDRHGKCDRFREAAFPQSAHQAQAGSSARAAKPGSPSGSHHATPPRGDKPMPPKRNVTADPARPPVHAESSKPVEVKVETGRPPKIFRAGF